VSSLSLDDSWGLSLQLGADYHINDKWLINASVRKLDIETNQLFEVRGIVAESASIGFDQGSQSNKVS
jgi:outer membrane protein